MVEILPIRVALLCYHKNISSIYPKQWVERFRDSIEDQTYQEFDIFEINYGSGTERIFEHSYFESSPHPTFVHALNYLLDKVFSFGYDVAANSNVDDWVGMQWLEKMLGDIQRGNDLVSCNFCLVKDEAITKFHRFHTLDILKELEAGHNPICHPAVCYTKKFWETNRYVPEEIPVEDLELWKRALRSGSKFFINEQNLLYHRLHNNSVCQSENR